MSSLPRKWDVLGHLSSKKWGPIIHMAIASLTLCWPYELLRIELGVVPETGGHLGLLTIGGAPASRAEVWSMRHARSSGRS